MANFTPPTPNNGTTPYSTPGSYGNLNQQLLDALGISSGRGMYVNDRYSNILDNLKYMRGWGFQLPGMAPGNGGTPNPAITGGGGGGYQAPPAGGYTGAPPGGGLLNTGAPTMQPASAPSATPVAPATQPGLLGGNPMASAAGAAQLSQRNLPNVYASSPGTVINPMTGQPGTNGNFDPVQPNGQAGGWLPTGFDPSKLAAGTPDPRTFGKYDDWAAAVNAANHPGWGK